MQAALVVAAVFLAKLLVLNAQFGEELGKKDGAAVPEYGPILLRATVDHGQVAI